MYSLVKFYLQKRHKEYIMNNLLEALVIWKEKKAKVFKIEEFTADMEDELEHELQARFIEIEGNGVLAKALLFEDGFLELTAQDQENKKKFIDTSCTIEQTYELDDKLNSWFNEVADYDEDEED